LGANSIGVFAESIGGGGGSGGFAGALSVGSGSTLNAVGGAGAGAGAGGQVNVANSGQIVTLGANSIGVFAESIGGGGGVGGLSLA
ncbi:hypothetical protein RMT89_44195, partial [Streptomyces sp. P17]|nr:hypothetical protein [Streptomyces sp. P17]